MTTYFFDRTFSPKLPRALSALGINTVAHVDKFGPDTPDDEWIADLRSTDWVIVTGDTRIRTKRAEALALQASGLTALFLFPAFSNWTLWSQAAWLVQHWPSVDAFVQQSQQGTLARIERSGAAKVFLLRTLQ